MNNKNINNVNFWRGNQNYSYVTDRREMFQQSLQQVQEEENQLSPTLTTSTIPTQITTQQIETNLQTQELGTPPTNENVATMPSSDGYEPQPDNPPVFGGGGYVGYVPQPDDSPIFGGSYGGSALQPELIEEGIMIPDNTILGIKQPYFYGGILITVIGGIYLYNQIKTKK